MQSSNLNKLKKLSVVVAAVIFTSACGKIPKQYRGQFADTATGAQLTLESSKGTIKVADGRVIETEAKDFEFESLVKGEAGIYVSMNETHKNLVEVYWLEPRAASRQEAAGITWFEAEVLYTRMDTDLKEEVKSFEIFHCREGNVMVDIPTHLWQAGCPSGKDTLHYNMIRVSN
ncbi:MAG: hypothetical protein AABZ55_11285 [Bdellovibrionota bacterium]